MNPPYQLIEGPYVHDLRQQPEAIWETTQQLAQGSLTELRGMFRHGNFDRVVLTGMGSSYHVLHALAPRLLTLGLPVVQLETSELIHTSRRQLTSRTCLIAVSQSGASAETVRLLELLPEGTRLVAITNTLESPLGRQAHDLVLTHAGAEHLVTCKTYVATVAACLWLAETLLGGEPDAVAQALGRGAEACADYLSWWRDHVEDLADAFVELRHLFILGRGTSLAAAHTAGLVIKEAAWFPAEAMSSAAFRHGPMELCGPEIGVLILEGTAEVAPLNHGLFQELKSRGAHAHLVGRQGDASPLKLPLVDDRLLPFVEILPMQMTSLALSALQGREAGRFIHATKITTTE